MRNLFRKYVRWKLWVKRRLFGDRYVNWELSVGRRILGDRFIDWIEEIESSSDEE